MSMFDDFHLEKGTILKNHTPLTEKESKEFEELSYELAKISEKILDED